MTTQTLQFIVVPDAGAARRRRRHLAMQGARSGIQVGTWPELVEAACRARLCPPVDDAWRSRFRDALGGCPQAFWAVSFALAPEETAIAIEQALCRIVSATDPHGPLEVSGLDALPARLARHVADLLGLARALGDDLPPELARVRMLLRGEGGPGLFVLRVELAAEMPPLTRWQSALVENLNSESPARVSGEPEPEPLPLPTSLASSGALAALQRHLFGSSPPRTAVDASVQWVGVRDALQEAEVAAGMVQELLRATPSLRPAEVGLLLPEHSGYATALRNAFGIAGLALSGLPADQGRRDFGTELVFQLLHCLHGPAPAMALAACFTSPLMPWSRAQGAALARDVMNRDFTFRSRRGLDARGSKMLDLLRSAPTAPDELSRLLDELVGGLAGEDALAEARACAISAAKTVISRLATAATIDWQVLRDAVAPKAPGPVAATEYGIEGVTVWRASQEPWRTVRRLIVLGFREGEYPAPVADDPVFSGHELQAIVRATGLPLRRPAEELSARRMRFLRQLGAVSGGITFLVPRRELSGAEQAPSASLVFMHQLFEGPDEPAKLVADLDVVDERRHVRHLALADAADGVPPRLLVPADLEFGRDLLAQVSARGGGKPRESPSSLETLMISPLAWLLKKLDAEPCDWAPEGTDPAVLGTLAHSVFEALFAPGRALPDPKDIGREVAALAEDRALIIAPFLRAAQWRIEFRHFVRQTTAAAAAWCHVLSTLGAEVLAAEEWLEAEWNGVPVRGQVDLVLALSGGRLLVVDYKRSSSGRRAKQMTLGFDSQASLYRHMIGKGTPTGVSAKRLAGPFRDATEVGVAYFMLGDRWTLSDAALPEARMLGDWRTFGGDISAAALERIANRLAALRAGRVELNRERDEEFFENSAGIKSYALGRSPLIGLFRMPDDAEFSR
jgi:ATP-dependent helicase/nuclease subunit B